MDETLIQRELEQTTLPHTRAQDAEASLLDRIRAGHIPQPAVHADIHAADPVLQIQKFNLYYSKVRALFDVTMSIPAGMVTAIIGPSGCGKSTLLRSVNRLNDLIDGVHIQGDIFLQNRSVYERGVDVIDLRKRIGMVFQKPNPFPMSIFENVVYPLRIDGERRKNVLRDACERALRSAALFDEVKDRLKASALELSGGQQQRLCIARAIVADPQLLLLDEPCSALDPIATVAIEELIRNIAKRYSVMIVTHNMQQASRVSHFTAFMYLGRLLEFGPTTHLFGTPTLRETEQYVTGRFG